MLSNRKSDRHFVNEMELALFDRPRNEFVAALPRVETFALTARCDIRQHAPQLDFRSGATEQRRCGFISIPQRDR
ncbi:hypothetical protein [Bradyrhizobium sp. 930_D9_N1_4]|uniref:hypothetical protein n=1 Tax=Bradyrhizobium sp. 930_D9_N1_4 TaxID=3240374 RepID=UPI003F8ADAF2